MLWPLYEGILPAWPPLMVMKVILYSGEDPVHRIMGRVDHFVSVPPPSILSIETRQHLVPAGSGSFRYRCSVAC
jgi:hypothetical protein